jgi:hypothetical protein
LIDDQHGFADSGTGKDAGSANSGRALFPLAKNWRAIGVCYSLWVILLLYDHWTTHRIGSGWLWASAFSSPLTHIGAFAFLAPLPWILPRRLPSPWNFILGFVLSVVVCELAAFLLPSIDGWFLARANVKFNLPKLVQLYTSLVGPAMMVVGGLVAARARSEELREASQAEAQVAKNRLLQSQIHPHVLFNALNGLAELVHKDARAAETAIRHLSDLLRRILVASEHMRLPLGEERMIVADYLALESIRLGNRLRVTWEWDENLDTIEVPPLLLQPLVENAIKHGIAPSIPGGDLILRARAKDGAIFLEVWNSGKPFPIHGNSSGAGIGVKNLRSRLALHFGGGARLSIGPSGQGTLACIRFEATQVEFSHEPDEGPGS